MNQNGSDQGRFRVWTGLDGDLTRYLNIVSWKGRRHFDLWPPGRESPCNSFRGASDGSAFGPFVDPSKKLRLEEVVVAVLLMLGGWVVVLVAVVLVLLVIRR